jgi:diguanylate cyclase (GGDEF)-like protein
LVELYPPDSSGLDTFAQFLRAAPQIPLPILTDAQHEVLARLAVRQGAHEYLILTDLPNRVLLHDRLNHAISLAHRRRKQLAVLYLDVDRFKHVNDTVGHETGDRLLQSVAGRLLGCVRRSDMVSRQGGDEFVILLSEINQAARATRSG